MNPLPAAHLDEQRILRILADGSALSEQEQAHMAACDQCAARLQNLQADLGRLQTKVRQYTPSLSRRFRLPAEIQPQPRHAAVWRIALAGAGTALLAAFIWWQVAGQGPRRPGGEYAAISPDAFRADPVMAQARALAQNALPKAYQAMAESLEKSDDEGFIDFLIPPLEPEAKS
jgi:hypothetical protein